MWCTFKIAKMLPLLSPVSCVWRGEEKEEMVDVRLRQGSSYSHSSFHNQYLPQTLTCLPTTGLGQSNMGFRGASHLPGNNTLSPVFKFINSKHFLVIPSIELCLMQKTSDPHCQMKIWQCLGFRQVVCWHSSKPPQMVANTAALFPSQVLRQRLAHSKHSLWQSGWYNWQ